LRHGGNESIRSQSQHTSHCCATPSSRYHGTEGGKRGMQLMSGSAPIKASQHASTAQYPGWHHDPLRRDAAGKGVNRARGRVGNCWRARAIRRSCGFVQAKSGACISIASHHWGSRHEEHSLESIGKAGRVRWRGVCPTVRGVAMNGSTTRTGVERRTAAAQNPVSLSGRLCAKDTRRGRTSAPTA
jgi:large subunit ribosomal protein L2